MVFPSAASAAIRSLIMIAAFTSSPDSGSSSRISSGLCNSAAAMRIFCRMPFECVSSRATRSDVRSKVSRIVRIRDCSVSSSTSCNLPESSRNSWPVRLSNSTADSGTYPIRCLTFTACSGGDSPVTDTRPDPGSRMPVMILRVVLLPAPFGPSRPTTSPRSSWNEMS